MFGDLGSIASGPAVARERTNFKGIGLTMEGVHQNPPVYELATETATNATPVASSVLGWIDKYVASRYNGTAAPQEAYSAWRSMANPSVGGVYTTWTDISNSGIINGAAALRTPNSSTLPALNPPGHNATNEVFVWRSLYRAAQSMEQLPSTLRYDLVDVARQSLDNLLWDVARLIESSFHEHVAWSANQTSILADGWLKLAKDLDSVLNTDSNFMVGPWIQAARDTGGDSSQEQDQLEFNARNQITLWGPANGGPSINDYARKQWGGLVETYYVSGRWKITLNEMISALEQNRTFDAAKVNQHVSQFQLAWQTNFSQRFPTQAQGDAVSVVGSALRRYAPNETAVRQKFSMLENMDAAPSVALLPQEAWSKDVGNLAFLCELDPSCAGFTSRGMLVSGVVLIPGGMHKAQGVRLYLKAV